MLLLWLAVSILSIPVAYVGFVLLRSFVIRPVQWHIRRRARYSHLPILPPTASIAGVRWVSMMPTDLQSSLEFVWKTMADARGRLPAVVDGGMFGACRQILLVVKPDDVKAVLSDPERFMKPPELRTFIEMLIGHGLVLAERDEWRRQRKMLTPVFHRANLRQMAPVIGDCVQRFVDNGALTRDYHDASIFGRLTLEIIIKSTFGGDFDVDWLQAQWEEALSSFRPWVMGRAFIGPLFERLPVRASTRHRAVMGRIRRRLRALVADRRRLVSTAATSLQQRNGDGGETMNLIDLMVSAPESAEFSDDQLVDQALTILFAGFETTSSAISFCVYYLCACPDEQERLRAELMPLLDDGASLASLTVEQLRSVPYLKAFVNETLRLRSPAPIIGRYVAEDTTLPSGIVAQAGSRVNVAVYMAHTDGEFYEQPLAFKPSRWLDGECSDRATTPADRRPLFLAFSQSKRSCIGERLARVEIYSAIVGLLSRYRIVMQESIDQVGFRSRVTVVPSSLHFKCIPLAS
jgi:cytochrome P450